MSHISISRRNQRDFEDMFQPPKARAFNKMVTFEMLTVLDQDEQPTIFTRSDCILVIPHPEDMGKIRLDGSLEPENYWKGKILDIRAETESAEVVWVKIRWFYTIKNLQVVFPTKVDNMKLELFGTNEIVFSDDISITEASTIESPCNILYFDDRSADIAQIDEDTFFWRLKLQKSSGRLTGRHKTCNNDPSCPGFYCPKTDIQRFCDSCKKWFHAGCLTRRQGQPPFPTNVVTTDDDLIRLAMRPIERGLVHGIVGNGQAQLAARRLLQEDNPQQQGASVLAEEIQYFSCRKCEAWI